MDRTEVFDLIMTLNRIFIKPQGPSVGRILIFNRDTEGVKLKENPYLPLHGVRRTIYGVIGIIKLILCKYLIVISQRSRVEADLRLQHSLVGVWRVDKVNLIPLAPGKVKLTNLQKEFNEEYILMVLSAFNTQDFYYSNKVDLTLSLRQQHTKRYDTEDSDNPFVWNYALLRDLIAIKGLEYYCIRLINGFVKVKYVKFQAQVMVMGLVSRRRNKRVGSRFFTTGLDTEGEAANFGETEIILEGENIVSSYTILRGSVPLLWGQQPTLSSNPKPLISRPDSQHLPFAKHFEYLSKRYSGPSLVIDLSQNCSHGKSIHQLYKSLAMNSEHLGLKFVELDLKMTLWKESKLDEDLLGNITDMGFTLVQNDVLIAHQKGAIRVSCLSCTDRANIAQSILVNVTLPAMLKTTIRPEMYRAPTEFELVALRTTYSSLWVAQGDALARHDTGTNALEAYLLDSDLKWRRRLYDQWILMKRWYINNFEDGFKQDSYDLVLGRYGVLSKKSYPKQSYFDRFNMIQMHYILPGFLIFSTILFVNVFIEFYEGVRSREEEKCVAVWSLIAAILWILFYCKFHHYADAPRLHVLKPHQPIHS